MKREELIELKTKATVDLKKKLVELQKEKVLAQIELKMGKSKDIHVVAKKKRDIAQIKTIIQTKQLVQETEQAELKEVKSAQN